MSGGHRPGTPPDTIRRSGRGYPIAQVARGRLRGDVEHALVQMRDQPEQVQVERAECEVQDVAGARRLKRTG